MLPLWLKLLPAVPIHHAGDAVFQVGHKEINQQPNFPAAQAQVRQKLSLVDRVNRLNALDF